MGRKGYQAEDVIRKENDELQTEVIQKGIPVSPDFQVKQVINLSKKEQDKWNNWITFKNRNNVGMNLGSIDMIRCFFI